jgi:hypothetical protein
MNEGAACVLISLSTQAAFFSAKPMLSWLLATMD